MPNAFEIASVLKDSIDRALADGAKHFNKAGVELLTTKAILECLRDEGVITIQAPAEAG